MADVSRHPRIDLLTLAKVEEVTGSVGNFKVKIRQKARYVDVKECTACGDCVAVCPVLVPNEFEMGLTTRRAIHQLFPQAVPAAYCIDMDHCLGINPIACGKCAEACDKNCISYDDKEKNLEFEVGTIIVATGLEVMDPTPFEEYGYGKFENVLSSIEFERIISPLGPTLGHLFRPSDRELPKSVSFVQCVGSRCNDGRGRSYCSNICCMNTIKAALLIKDHWPETEVKVFYIDIRAFGKGFEDMYNRSKAAGTLYIRGIPGEIMENPETKGLVLSVENGETGQLEEHESDMVILSVGMEAPADMRDLQTILNLQKTPDDFYLEAHPKLQPVDAATKGVFFAGCAEAPKDVKDSVTQAGAAAARALGLMALGHVKIPAITSVIDADACNFCGTCAKACPYGAITVDRKTKTPAVVAEAACAGCGTCGAECTQGAITMKHFTDEQTVSQVDAMLVDHAQDKIVVFACNWCSYAGGDFAGVSRLQYPPTMRLIRTMCSGRVDKKWILHAFAKGAPVVLVSGCHYVDCHYIDANRWTQKRVERLWDLMEKKGIRPERLQLEWISSAQASRFQDTMKAIEVIRKTVTAEEIEATKEALAKNLLEVEINV
jgi:heterodisulfide reductase subunit A2